ncbi:MAG TPA: helix-turn-helix domain-containing protein, partial [Nitrososphaeraceae archaeon]|nr:helix-turn-helix domain-containing protein [Nitrososphaeraceae archaeon]
MSQIAKDQQSELVNKGDESESAILPQVKFVQCPIKTSLGVLGKKWTILILRDIGFLKIVRFNRILESIPGLTPRVLSMRLRELENEGFIECAGGRKNPIMVVW